MESKETVLEVSSLSGGYSEESTIINDIHFSIHRGEIVGLIGLNGAGKSTTMKMLLGLLRPSQGEIRIGNYNLLEEPEKAKAMLGYIPEIPLLYDELTLADHLRFTAMAYRMTEAEMQERMTLLLEAFRMEEHLDEFPSTFSKGMRQKVMVLCAFLHQPDLFLVDEPFIGLDPKAYRELTNLLIESKERGAGALVSTHVLDSAERLCDRFMIMHAGKIIAIGTLTELRQRVRNIANDNSDEDSFINQLLQKPEQEWSLLELFECLIEAGDRR